MNCVEAIYQITSGLILCMVVYVCTKRDLRVYSSFLLTWSFKIQMSFAIPLFWRHSYNFITDFCSPFNFIDNVFDAHQGTHILQSLDGFAFALGQDGRFLYISETVSIYLGLSQVELTGSSVFDYIHQQDHVELAELLGINHSQSHSTGLSSPLPPASVGSTGSSESESTTPYSNSTSVMTVSGSDTLERQFCIRMKSTLTKRGCQHFKSSGYRVVHVIAHLRPELQQQQRRKFLLTSIIFTREN